jgi:hypothetical protein
MSNDSAPEGLEYKDTPPEFTPPYGHVPAAVPAQEWQRAPVDQGSVDESEDTAVEDTEKRPARGKARSAKSS